MVADDGPGSGSDRRERFRKGLPGYHDPTAGIGGAAPAVSALTLRLCLAVFGLVICTALAIWLYVVNAPMLVVVVLVVLAAAAVIDLAVILRRKRRGEPG
jgi:Flp pilus assembly protein TadB